KRGSGRITGRPGPPAHALGGPLVRPSFDWRQQMFRSFLIGVTLLGLVHSAVVAQTCTGLASYSWGPIQLAGHGSVVTEAGIHQLGASLGYGRTNSVFGDGSIASTSADGGASYLSSGG